MRFLFSIGVASVEIESLVDVAAGTDGAMWKIHRPTGRRRFRVLGVPMPWSHR